MTYSANRPVSAEVFIEKVEAKSSAKLALPVVILHGWGQRHQSFLGLAKLLADSREVYLLDLPGFGKSKPVPDDWSLDRISEFLADSIEQRGLKEYSLIGHSFGGQLSVRIAAKRKDSVKALCLIGASGLKRHRSLKSKIRMFFVGKLSKVLKTIDSVFSRSTFQKYFVPRFGSRDYQAAGTLRPLLVKAVTDDVSPYCETIDIPSLLLWGELDKEAPLDLARRFHLLLSASKLLILPLKDHFPHEDTGAHLLAYHLRKFLP